MKKNKDFDCVEMMHKGAEYVTQRLAGLTREEELQYWEKRTEELRAKQAAMQKQNNAFMREKECQ